MPFWYTKLEPLDPDRPDLCNMPCAYNERDEYIGSPEDAAFLCGEKGIRPELAKPGNSVCSVGFCELDRRWYGWSHRAMYGFTIGDKCAKGDVHYTASTPEDLIEQSQNFWAGSTTERRYEILEDRSGIIVYTANAEGIVLKCGRGEWVAETYADARQMAVEFAEAVS